MTVVGFLRRFLKPRVKAKSWLEQCGRCLGRVWEPIIPDQKYRCSRCGFIVGFEKP